MTLSVTITVRDEQALLEALFEASQDEPTLAELFGAIGTDDVHNALGLMAPRMVTALPGTSTYVSGSTIARM